jgi:hypothetical protein
MDDNLFEFDFMSATATADETAAEPELNFFDDFSFASTEPAVSLPGEEEDVAPGLGFGDDSPAAVEQRDEDSLFGFETAVAPAAVALDEVEPIVVAEPEDSELGDFLNFFDPAAPAAAVEKKPVPVTPATPVTPITAYKYQQCRLCLFRNPIHVDAETPMALEDCECQVCSEPYETGRWQCMQCQTFCSLQFKNCPVCSTAKPKLHPSRASDYRQPRTALLRCEAGLIEPSGIYQGFFSLFPMEQSHLKLGKHAGRKTDLVLCFWGYADAKKQQLQTVLLSLPDICRLLPRMFKLRRCAIEISIRASTNSFFFNFRIPRLHEEPKQSTKRGEMMRNTIVKALCSRLKLPSKLTGKLWLKQSNLTVLWQQRKMSNFEYLFHLNSLAGRSYKDISQFPVFPWVLQDYTSNTLDLKDPGVYRDLSQPMGALNPKRWKEFETRYESFKGDKEHALAHGVIPTKDDNTIEPFMYGSHYSNEGIVLYYLLRQQPYTDSARQLQGGKFDLPDRLFTSVHRAWELSLNETSDVKELTPEFYTGSGQFLMNEHSLELGKKQDGTLVNDVELPPWADNDPQKFIDIMRQALESDYVSAHLHLWIDLIFGEKQQGKSAELAKNVFFYLTYVGNCDVDQIADVKQRESVEAQIQHFGQTPDQLFTKLHPARLDRNGVPMNTVTGSYSSVQGNATRRASQALAQKFSTLGRKFSFLSSPT